MGEIDVVNEVSADTARMVLDTLDARQLDAGVLWAGLPVERTRLRQSRARIDWDVWVEMMDRIEVAVGSAAMEQLFVAGGGPRPGPPPLPPPHPLPPLPPPSPPLLFFFK